MSRIIKGHRSYDDPIIRGDMSDVYIGKYTSIAQGVIVDCGFHHKIDAVSLFPFTAIYDEYKSLGGHPVSKGDIHIGSDCWIGEGSLIMGGVSIGDGAVIGARSVVTKSVSPYSIVAGSPARHIRWRFSLEEISKLLEIKWWDWEEEKVKKFIPYLISNNINEFFNETNRI